MSNDEAVTLYSIHLLMFSLSATPSTTSYSPFHPPPSILTSSLQLAMNIDPAEKMITKG